MWNRLIAASLLLTMLAGPALALDHRPFPPAARRGTMTIGEFPQVVLNGTNRLMTIGARIWNANNMMQLPGTLLGAEVVVNYTEDLHGQIDRVWILTPEEAAQTPAEQNIQTQ